MNSSKKTDQKSICFFNSNSAWGGGEKWHFNTCIEFQRRGYHTILVTNLSSELFKKASEIKLHVYSFYIHNLSFLNPFKVLSLVRLFKNQKVETILLNLPSDLKVAGIAAKIAGVKNIIYRRGMPHPLKNTWLNRFLFKKVLTHVVVNSVEIGNKLQSGNESWFPKDKLALVYNGVDSQFIPPKEKKIYEKKNSELVLGNAGRLTNQKGQKYLIELGVILKKENIPFKILIAGEGELKEKLKNLIRVNNLEENIILLGHVSDMPMFFSSLDQFIFTSLFEGSANTLIETLQFQVPCIAFNVSSNPEILIHEKTGILINPFDIEELKNQVLRLNGDALLTQKLVQNAQDLIKDKFDYQKNISVLESLL